MITKADIGSLFIVGIKGPTLTTEEKELLAEIQPSGIILFRKNLSQDPTRDWIQALHQLLCEIRSVLNSENIFVSIDHEGGRVHRFSSPVTHFPAAANWGENTPNIATTMAKELQLLGFNLTFSPVLDVFSEQQNTVIGDRAFATQALEVAQFGRVAIEAFQRTGILCCAKHFPGHGATIADSHLELPHLDITRVELFARELLPFIEAVNSDVPMIMTAHVRYPQIDPIYPATFSTTIIRDILRDELNFQGVIVTDDLEMLAICNYSRAERAVLALAAGADLLLEGNPRDEIPVRAAAEMVEGVWHALNIGRLTEPNLQKSIARVTQLKQFLLDGSGSSEICSSANEFNHLCQLTGSTQMVKTIFASLSPEYQSQPATPGADPTSKNES